MTVAPLALPHRIRATIPVGSVTPESGGVVRQNKGMNE